MPTSTQAENKYSLNVDLNRETNYSEIPQYEILIRWLEEVEIFLIYNVLGGDFLK